MITVFVGDAARVPTDVFGGFYGTPESSGMTESKGP